MTKKSVKKTPAKALKKRAVRKKPQVKTSPDDLVLVTALTVADLPSVPPETPRYLVWSRKIVPIVNRVVLISSITVYVLAFVLAAIGTFAATPVAPSNYLTPEGTLGTQLKQVGIASSYASETGETVNPGIILAKFLANFFFGKSS